MIVPGNLYVIAAPSGTGKTTLVKELTQSLTGITVSISHTTRIKRPAEIDGSDYYFIQKPEFLRMVKNQDFLEYATVFKYYYGTSRTWVEKTLAQGLDVILEIDWQGCQQIQCLFAAAISIFILPPSLADLEKRLKNRSQDSPEIIQQRLVDAQTTVAHLHEFNYVVINADFNTAVKDLKTIIEAGRLTHKKQAVKFAKLLGELL